VGSSFGGLMATLFAMENEGRVDRLVLLAPAINLLWFTSCPINPLSIPVWIYHGRNDEVIPIGAVEQMADTYFSHCSFHKVDDDHFLHHTFQIIDWDRLLGS
jgi:pimeloyl-ACP methyl ester carboxylesterase